MQRRKVLKRIAFALAVILNLAVEITALLFLFFAYIYPIKATAPVYTYELGAELITDTDYYVDANQYALARSNIDFSKVNMSKIGSYPVQIKRAFQLLEVQIEIVDTTPPTLQLIDKEIYLEVGEPYNTDKFVSSVSDLSGSVNLEIRLGNEANYGNQVAPDALGEYTVYVKATDSSGNYAILSKQITADTAPQISFSKDIMLRWATQSTINKM